MSTESYHFEQLPNGMEVCLVDLPYAQTVRTRMFFKDAGNLSSPVKKPEVAHLAEHSVLKGCTAYPVAEGLYEVMDRSGSQIDAATSDGYMQYSLVSPSTDYKMPFNALLRTVEAPLFRPAEVNAEREAVRQELHEALENNEFLLWPHLARKAGINSPTVHDSLNTLDTIQPRDLRLNHAATHILKSLSVTVTANFSAVNQTYIIDELNNIQLPFDANTRPRLQLHSSDVNEVVTIDDPRKSSVFYSLIKLHLPRLALENEVAYDMAFSDLVWFRNEGMCQYARNQGLIYGFDSGRSFNYDTCSDYWFRLQGSVARNNTTALFKLYKEKMKGFDTDETFTNFEKLRAYTIGTLLLSCESPEKIHDRAADSFCRLGTAYSVQDELQMIQSITEDEVLDARRNLLKGGVAVVGAIGPGIAKNKSVDKALSEVHALLQAG